MTRLYQQPRVHLDAKPSLQALLGALLKDELSSDEFQVWFAQLNTNDKLTLLEQLDSRINKEPVKR